MALGKKHVHPYGERPRLTPFDLSLLANRQFQLHVERQIEYP